MTTAPTLPSNTLSNDAYYSMFENCTSLTTAPALPYTSTIGSCYKRMFFGCTSLTTPPPQLPATQLSSSACYGDMFNGCTSLTYSPEIFATSFSSSATWALGSMFKGCTQLSTIKIHYTGNFTSGVPNNAFTDWVNGVAGSGTFYYDGTDTTRGDSAIPEGWTIKPYACLSFEAK